MSEQKQVDPKAWVRQNIAIIATVYLAVMGVGYGLCRAAGLPTLDASELAALTGWALTVVLWFFGSREVEKKANKGGE